jgi:hypothetical protein
MSKLLLVVIAGSVIGATLTTIAQRMSLRVGRLADPSNASPAERLREGLLAGRYGPSDDQLDRARRDSDVIETEIVTEGITGTPKSLLEAHHRGRIELRTHPHFVAAVRYLLDHSAVVGGDFGQIVITQLDEPATPKLSDPPATLGSVDHRELLKRYMRHVSVCEGTTFVDEGLGGTWQALTPEQQTELRAIETELREEETR